MRWMVAVVAMAVLMGTASIGAVGAPASTGADPAEAPGAEVASVVMVEQAVIESEVEVRAYAKALEQAETPAERADIVADRIAADESRLADLQDDLDEIEHKFEQGEMPEGQYRAAIAVTAIEMATVENTIAQSAAEAPDLAEHLEERGVSVERIHELRTNASEMTGEEVAAIAKDVAGVDVDAPGPPADLPGNASVDDIPADADDRPGNGSAADVPGGPDSDDDPASVANNSADNLP